MTAYSVHAVPAGSEPRAKSMSPPPTQYAKSGDASIAYQVVGDGPLDLVLVLGFATHLELQWESPAFARFFERLSSFSRLIIFDKRGLDCPTRSPRSRPSSSGSTTFAPSWTRPVRNGRPSLGSPRAGR